MYRGRAIVYGDTALDARFDAPLRREREVGGNPRAPRMVRAVERERERRGGKWTRSGVGTERPSAIAREAAVGVQLHPATRRAPLQRDHQPPFDQIVRRPVRVVLAAVLIAEEVVLTRRGNGGHAEARFVR